MAIGGVSIILLLGILNLLLILFQVTTGRRWIKVPLAWHRRGALMLLVSAVFHAILAFLVAD
jgi:hypothetical protein